METKLQSTVFWLCHALFIVMLLQVFIPLGGNYHSNAIWQIWLAVGSISILPIYWALETPLSKLGIK